METNGEARKFVIMAAQKIHWNQPEPTKGEALGSIRRRVK